MEGLELPAKMVSKEKTKKRAFTDEEVSTISRLLAPYKTFPKSVHPKDQPAMRIEWYWCVLCLAFTGARRTEIGQLLPSDIKKIDGVWCFDLIESDDDDDDGAVKVKVKELKNAPSRRIVPIHSQLIEAGFLQWFEAQPASDRVFPLLWQKGLSKVTLWFTYMLIKNKLKTPAISLHSFRHTMTVKLEKNRTHGSLMRRLLGHSLGNDTESRVYLGSLTYDVKELQTALEAVRFPTIG